MTTVEDMASLLELNALVFLAVAYTELEDKKLLWKRLKNDLKNVDLNQLPYNYPLCSGILDIESSPISDLPKTLCNVFEEKQKKN
ncbi:14865_t:CDS:2, partial [Dentiscutata heterogama]